MDFRLEMFIVLPAMELAAEFSATSSIKRETERSGLFAARVGDFSQNSIQTPSRRCHLVPPFDHKGILN